MSLIEVDDGLRRSSVLNVTPEKGKLSFAWDQLISRSQK